MGFKIKGNVLKRYTEKRGEVDVVIPDGVTSIGYEAFYDCTSLQTITIPDSVTSIGDYAFRYCKSLQTITIPDSLTDIGFRAFDGTLWLDNYQDDFVVVNGVLIDYKGEDKNIVIRHRFHCLATS